MGPQIVGTPGQPHALKPDSGPPLKEKTDSQKYLSHYLAGTPVNRTPALWTL